MDPAHAESARRLAAIAQRRRERMAAAAPPPPAVCPRRGLTPLRLVPCSCAGGGRDQTVAVYACTLHGRCTDDPRRAARDGTVRCQTCDSRPPPARA